MNTAEGIERFFQPAEEGETVEAEAVERKGAEQSDSTMPDALGRALESLYPAGCLERIGTMTDAEIDEYAGRFGVTGAELVAGIFDPARNADYMNYKRAGGA